MLAKALKSFKDAGDFDASILEWEARPAIAQTFGNFMVVMYAEFSKLNRQDATTARATGHASANNVVEQMAKATEELVAELTERHSNQVESIIKSNSEVMEKLTAAILANKPTASTVTANKSAKAAAWAEKKRIATTCPHCNRKHPNHTSDHCWELPANAAKRPADWKSRRALDNARGRQ
jgi:hypothetical protein